MTRGAVNPYDMSDPAAVASTFICLAAAENEQRRRRGMRDQGEPSVSTATGKSFSEEAQAALRREYARACESFSHALDAELEAAIVLYRELLRGGGWRVETVGVS